MPNPSPLPAVASGRLPAAAGDRPEDADRDPVDVERLVRDSAVRARPTWPTYLLIGLSAAGLAAVVFGSAGTAGTTGGGAGGGAGGAGGAASVAVPLAATLLVLGTVGAAVLVPWSAVRAHRAEGRAVERAESLVQLRRWPEAAATLSDLLGGPMRNPVGRARALVALSAVLMRYERFESALSVHDHLLDDLGLDGPAGHAVRVGRAMAQLRADHLYDADRSISALRQGVRRQGVRRAGGTTGAGQGGGQVSAGLALVELYRDVKTGHPDDAAAGFERNADAIRDQLGHRVADAWVLAAAAYDRLGRPDDARAAYANATRLVPARELHRRYPETRSLAETYPPATPPTS